MSPGDMNYEDAFVVGDDGWITLPGEEGKISPDGVLHDTEGKALFSINEDQPLTLDFTIEDVNDN